MFFLVLLGAISAENVESPNYNVSGVITTFNNAFPSEATAKSTAKPAGANKQNIGGWIMVIICLIVALILGIIASIMCVKPLIIVEKDEDNFDQEEFDDLYA